MHDTINGAMFKEMLLFGTVSIAQAQQAINDLNVFPVPDGFSGLWGVTINHTSSRSPYSQR